MEQTSQTPVSETNNKKNKGVVRDFFEAFVVALIIALPIKFFIASPFIVVGASMYPTFENGNYLIVDKLVYRFNAPKRGDVVVFNPPFTSSEYFIKRIVGLPGETISVDGNKVKITNKDNPNGFILPESYVSSERAGIKDVTLGDDQYFVMGDNRAVSSDSRVWGPISKEEISGRVDLQLFPLTKIGLMPGALK
jgi:signal peptidase I